MLLALAGSVAAGAGIAVLARPTFPVWSAAEVAPMFESERAIATSAGLLVVEESTSPELTVRREIPVEAGECVALVATADGLASLGAASLTLLTGERSTLDPSSMARVVHQALCARVQTTAVAEVSLTQSGLDGLAPSHARFAILRGVVPSPRLYTRLTLDDATREALDAIAIRAREAELARYGHLLGERREVSRGTAVLVPPSRATHAAVHVALGAHTLPRIDPADAASDPFRAEGDVTLPARVHTSTGLARLLAVVDPGALGASCVRLTFARLAQSSVAVQVRRVAIPSIEESELALLDPAIAGDTICPATGLFFYTVDEDDGGGYLVSAYAHATSDGRPAAPSRFEPVPLPSAELLAAQRGCADGRTTECLRLAGLAAQGIEGAGSPGPSLERACGLGDGEGCDRLATFVSASPIARERERAGVHERRACATGYVPACLRRAGRFREGASDLPAAHLTYRFACGLGDASACAAVSTLEEWQLATPEPLPPTAESLP